MRESARAGEIKLNRWMQVDANGETIDESFLDCCVEEIYGAPSATGRRRPARARKKTVPDKALSSNWGCVNGHNFAWLIVQ